MEKAVFWDVTQFRRRFGGTYPSIFRVEYKKKSSSEPAWAVATGVPLKRRLTQYLHVATSPITTDRKANCYQKLAPTGSCHELSESNLKPFSYLYFKKRSHLCLALSNSFHDIYFYCLFPHPFYNELRPSSSSLYWLSYIGSVISVRNVNYEAARYAIIFGLLLALNVLPVQFRGNIIFLTACVDCNKR
jgi:hypothetical protein